MTDFAQRRTMMVDTQVRPNDVTSYPVIEAMLNVPREQFVPDSRRDVAYAGGNIALVQEGDSITIDAKQLLLELHVSEEELAKRRAAWVKPAPRYVRGVQAKFAKNAASASKGAVLDDFCGEDFA